MIVQYIESRNTDPYYNLALEQFVFDRLNREDNYFMLWQNCNAIIVGKHQSTREEINTAFVKENNIAVVRRLSGGGAVYHDLGNLNFTFIAQADKQDGIDFSFFCEPISKALCSFGVPVEISGRNDMTVEGKKFSGNAQYIREGRVMHHGTILYDSDLDMLSRVLKPAKDKIESRGIKSLKSRVTNIRPYMKTDMPISGFWSALRDFMISAFDMKEFPLNSEHKAAVEELREKVYSRWSWNYGYSPPHTMRKTGRIEGCGKIEIFLDIEKDGIIKNLAFYGDFFGNRELSGLTSVLIGHHLEYNEIKTALKSIDIFQYFHALDTETFLALLLE
jgi:lipoate-protein ligase A